MTQHKTLSLKEKEFRISVILAIVKRKFFQPGITQLVNSALCSHFEFAVKAGRILKIKESALKKLIEPIKQSTLERPARRPIYTPMRCLVSERLGLTPIRDWRAALAEYIRKNCQ